MDLENAIRPERLPGRKRPQDDYVIARLAVPGNRDQWPVDRL